MLVSSLTKTRHTLVLKELDDVGTTLESESFAPHLALMEKEGLPAGMSSEVHRLVSLYRKERVAQVNHNRTMLAESGRARTHAEAGKVWISYVQNRGRMLKLTGHSDADSIATLIGIGDTETGSSVEVQSALEELLGFLDTNPEAVKLQLDVEMREQGRQALTGMAIEHADAVDARVAREYETQAMRDYNDELTRKLDLIMLVKEQVELRYRVKLHGLELALLRSQAADGSDDEDEAPEQGAPATGETDAAGFE